MLHNPSTRVNQYEYVGKWDKVLLNYDVKLSHSHEAKAANGDTFFEAHPSILFNLNLIVFNVELESYAWTQ